MNYTKKRQHYVWRHYLKPWANKENIWTYFKNLNKIEHPNLMGVAQEKYFYKLVDFTEDEEIFLNKFIDKLSHPAVKDLNMDFLQLFTSTGKLKVLLEQSTNPKIDKSLYSEMIRKMEINLMEDAHCKMEELGEKLIQYRSLDDLKTILDEDYIFEGIMFLMFQYIRTKNMKKLVLQKYIGDKYKNIIEKSWNILSYALATTMSRSISLDRRIKFVFIENNSDNNFITGDQPVFNLLGNKLNENGDVAELELYYPLTPKCAINIHFRSEQIEQFENKYADRKLVDSLNKKVFENSDYYLFSDTKGQLEEISKNNWL